MRGSPEGDIERAQAGGGDLGDVDPADRAPAELEEGREEEDADERDISGRDDGLPFLWWRDTDVEPDVQHRERLRDRRPQQGPPSPQGIRDEDEKRGAAGHLDDAVDAGREEVGRVALHAEVLEDLGRIVVDGVRAGHLLAYHQDDADDGALPVPGYQPHLLHQVPEAGAADQLALVLELVDDVLELAFDVWVVWRQRSDFGEGCLGFLPSVLFGEESGRLVAQKHPEEQENCWKGLHGKRYDVHGGTADVEQ